MAARWRGRRGSARGRGVPVRACATGTGHSRGELAITASSASYGAGWRLRAASVVTAWKRGARMAGPRGGQLREGVSSGKWCPHFDVHYALSVRRRSRRARRRQSAGVHRAVVLALDSFAALLGQSRRDRPVWRRGQLGGTTGGMRNRPTSMSDRDVGERAWPHGDGQDEVATEGGGEGRRRWERPDRGGVRLRGMHRQRGQRAGRRCGGCSD